VAVHKFLIPFPRLCHGSHFVIGISAWYLRKTGIAIGKKEHSVALIGIVFGLFVEYRRQFAYTVAQSSPMKLLPGRFV